MNRAEKRRQQNLAEKAVKNKTPGQFSAEQALQFALQHHSAGRLPEAKKIYEQILAADPSQSDALHLLGVVASQSGQFDIAIDLITRVLTIAPDYAEAHNNLGNAFEKGGRLDEAITSYQKALAIMPNYPEAHYNLGRVFEKLEKFDEAVTSYQKALAIKPDLAQVHNNLGNAFDKLGRMDEAVASFHKAIGIQPDYVEAYSNLGNALKNLGRLDEAVASYHTALGIKPDYVEAHSNLGLALKTLGQLDEALASYQKALAINPDSAGVHSNLGLTLKEFGKLDEATACFRKALAIKPDYAGAHSNLLFTSQYQPGFTLKALNELHAGWDQRHGVPLQSEWRAHGNDPVPAKKLRIGFVSPDLGRHPVGYFVVRLLEHKQENDVAFICYADRPPDDLTERMQALSDEWTDARGISDEALSEHIRSDKIDILIDLAGHTARNRLLAFARKPAPIQVTWAGYMGSTGLSAVDYLIADSWHVPESTEGDYSERILRLPNGYICYEPPDYAPEVGPLPFDKNGFITFACFNNPAKINDGVLAAWMEIRKAVPNSKLILSYQNMDARGNHDRFLNHFGAGGIDGARLIVEGRAPRHSDVFARYNDIDIALDTFPYSGGLTTCEALWMGVPVITKPEDTFASRHSLSHLSNIGVAELVADDLSGYVAKTVELANDGSRLAGLRSELRGRMAKSPLCDGERFASDFTAAMRHIWQQWCGEVK